MVFRIILLAHLMGLAADSMAQTSFSKWVVQDADTLGDLNNGATQLIHLAQGDILYCTCRHTVSFTRCRFVRFEPTGDLVAQRDVSGLLFSIVKMVELDDGTLACVGVFENKAFYLRLDPTGVVLSAKSYTLLGGGLPGTISSWSDVVQCKDGKLALAGTWHGMGFMGMVARIEADGTLLSHKLFKLAGQDPTRFNSVAVLPGGDLLFGGVSGTVGLASLHQTHLLRTDSLLNTRWARTYADTAYEYSAARAMIIPGTGYRMLGNVSDTSAADGTLLLATDTLGDPQWATRYLPPPGYADMDIGTAVLMDNGSIVVTGASGSGANDAFVQVLDPAGAELALVELDIPPPRAGCRIDSGTFMLASKGYHPSAPTNMSFGITRLDMSLEYCRSIAHASTPQPWAPAIDTTWSETTVVMTVSDLSSQFGNNPTPAYTLPICISTEVPDGDRTRLSNYPNPATDRLTIDAAGPGLLKVFDAIGRCCLMLAITGKGPVEVDVSTLPPAHYTIVLNTGDDQRHARFTVQK